MSDSVDMFHLMLSVNGKLEKPFEDCFRGEFTRVQLNLLCTLFSAGPMTVCELAEHLHAPRQQVSKLVEKLYEEGRILRNCDPADRRKTLISVSKETERHIAKRREAFFRALNRLLEPACREEGEDFEAAVETVNRILTRIHPALSDQK